MLPRVVVNDTRQKSPSAARLSSLCLPCRASVVPISADRLSTCGGEHLDPAYCGSPMRATRSANRGSDRRLSNAGSTFRLMRKLERSS